MREEKKNDKLKDSCLYYIFDKQHFYSVNSSVPVLRSSKEAKVDKKNI